MKKSRKHRLHPLRKKILIGLAIALGLLVFVGIWLDGNKTPSSNIIWGTSFSHNQTDELGIPYEESYLAILNDLKPKQLRLTMYWNTLEPEPGKYNFKDLDWQTAEADKRHIPYMIVIGQKTPRYPECYEPKWALALPLQQEHEKQLEMMSAVVRRYDDRPGLIAWQVENEPFVKFGRCPATDEPFIAQEASTVRSLSNKPLVMTDSGELSLWLQVTKYPDVFGTTLYRSAINGEFHFAFHYPIPAFYYTIRANIVKKLYPQLHRTIVVELQGEPWAETPLNQQNQEYYAKTMTPEQFDANIKFTDKVGMPEAYTWGAEWWYYQKLHGHSWYWNRAKQLFAGSR